MDDYTEKTLRWLEERYNRGVENGQYRAHRPIYGFGVSPSEPSHTNRLAIALSLLRVLNRVDGKTLVDLGGGEGYIAALARDILGYESMLVELPEAACQRGRELFGLPAETSDVHTLPFADNSVDVTLLSEVVEHLQDPFLAMAEAWRVTKNVLIISTQETYPWEWERMARHRLRDLDRNHTERNHFHPNDFRALFGNDVELLNPCLVIPLEDERKINEEQARKLVPYLAKPLPFNPGSFGVLAVVQKTPSDSKPRVSDQELVEKLFDFRVPLPNVSREKDVPKINWPKKRGESDPTGTDKMSPLAETWNAAQRKHIERISSMFAASTKTGEISGYFSFFQIFISAVARFILSPGSAWTKLHWASRIIDKRRLRKLFGG